MIIFIKESLFFQVLQPCDIEISKTVTPDETTTVWTSVSAVDLRLSTSTVHTIRDVVDELMASLKVRSKYAYSILLLHIYEKKRLKASN